MECFRLRVDYLAWIKHQFLSDIRDSRKTGSQWGMMRGVGGVRKSLEQSWLAKGLYLPLGLLCWGFKGVQEEILSEEASTLQVGSVEFPPGQYTSPQLHPCHRLFDQNEHQDSSSPFLWDERGCDEGHWHAYIRGLPWGLLEVVGMVQEVHCNWRRLLGRGLEFHVLSIKVSIRKKSSIVSYVPRNLKWAQKSLLVAITITSG